ncbi:MAG TPA: HEAT repeat domain-containing protein [Vicinamibacterales bacterium]|nr:HEAT repeat domain-containing protein [Vicinamibacterales bacterium]
MHTTDSLGVVTTDRQLAIRGWNEWVAEATGLPERDVAGRPLLDYVAPERADYYRDIFTEVIASGSARVLAPAFHKYLIECRPHTSSAHFDHMQQRVTIAPLMADASVVGVMITIEDVTERLDRERNYAAMLDPAAGARRTDALASQDWQVRGEAVRHLKQSASVDELRHLFDTLHRDHHDLNVLNSALRVLIAAGRTVVEPLVQLLSDKAANLRMHAALALGELKAQEATPELVTALNDPDENVRFHAIEALGRIGAAESVDPLAKIAGSDNFFLAFAAIDALGKTDDARVSPLMVSLLDQELLRPAAIATLAAIGDEECVPALARALNQDSSEVGTIAAALAKIHDRYEHNLGAGSFIIEATSKAVNATGRAQLAAAVSSNDADRAGAATVLSWLGRDALTPLMEIVGDESLQTSIEAGIIAIGADAVLPLIARLDSSSASARIAAAQLLGRIGDRRATPALLDAVNDSEADAAASAAAALGSLGDPAALDGLIGVLGHPNAVVRRAAISAVNSIGAADTARRIQAVIRDPNPRLRESAIRIAGYFGFDDTLPALVDALNDRVEDVRRAAIEQLPLLDDVDATSRLTAALTAETPRNRAAAAHAMRQLDDPHAGSALRNALQDEDAWVRYFAATSLGDKQLGQGHADALVTLARRDAATHVRIAAITALGAVDSGLAARTAIDLLDDRDDDLAIAAVKVLGSLARPDAQVLLERAARSTRPGLQLAAIRALATRPTVESVEILGWAARVTDTPSLAQEAINSLQQIGASTVHPLAARAAVDALRGLAAEGTRRLEVIGALARLPEFAVADIASGLSAGRVAVRVATAEALAAMRHPRASSELARALRDESSAVRSAAVAGFARLGTPGVGRTIAGMRHSDPDEGVRRRADLACARHGWGAGLLQPRA